jgi:glycyl-tRNA synthetase beta chain
MPDLLLELFSEEIPARMQARAAADLTRLLSEALAPLTPKDPRSFYGPRRVALALTVAAEIPATAQTERGPRLSAPEQAITGFLRKHGANRDQLRQEGEHWVLHRSTQAESAKTAIARAIPPLLRRFPWPKSMRWGATSAFTWVRPLRRILCLLDGETVPFDLREGTDDGHGLIASNLTEGHRFHAPGAFAVTGLTDWQIALERRYVIADQEQRRARIANDLAQIAAKQRLTLVDDPGLLDEVTGLVDWPVIMLGRIDDTYMSLPAEVMQVSMRVNQRYFALRQADGTPAPVFAFVANIAASDGGATIIAGNERVLRARFSDARHFWDADQRTPLSQRVGALEGVTFHAKLGSQADRVRRLEKLATTLAPAVGAPAHLAARAARLAKADLTTGMVGEFPELQGVMGRYYALLNDEHPDVADAIRDHYLPRGPSDPPPATPVPTAMALADKLDQLVAFFGIGERPTGAGDPYALRRAALGIIRIIREHALRLALLPLISAAAEPLATSPDPADILAFLVDRLRVQLRAEGLRHDVLTAVFGAAADDDLVRLMARATAVTALLVTSDGTDLLAAYRRAANILRIEDARDGPHTGQPDETLATLPDEQTLAAALRQARPTITKAIVAEDFTAAMSAMALLRKPIDDFFANVIVNDTLPAIRVNRLRLLAQMRDTMNLVADFAKLEG